MKKNIIYLLAMLMLLGYGCRNKNKYADLPPELAELCQNIDKHPKKAENYYARANYYYLNKEIEKGLADIQTAIKLQPDSSKYYVTLSDLYFAQHETDLTEEALLKAISMDEDNNEARLKLAELQFYTRQYDDCGKTIDAAVQRQPHNPKAYLVKAFMLKDLMDTVGYLRMLQLVIDQDPNEVKAYSELGYFYQQQNDPIAISYYQNGLKVDPKNVELHYNLGKMFQDMDKFEEAEQEYKTAIGIDSAHIPSLNNLGYLYLDDNFKKYDEAVKLFTQVLQVNPQFVYAVCNRGVAYEYLGNYVAARKDYEEALKLSTNFEPAIKGLNRLDKLQH